MEKESNGQKQNFGSKWLLVIIITILAVVVLVVVGARLYMNRNESNDSKSAVESVPNVTASNQAEVPVETAIEQIKRIYYTEDNKLYSINPVDKKIEEIDTNISDNGGSIVMSFDQLKVAYVKNDEVWLKVDGNTQEKIKQNIPKNNDGSYDGSYDWRISGWSSDSNNFTYSVAFSCSEMGEDGCSESDEDKDATGVFWYSLVSKKSTKLPILGNTWLPNSNKVSYMELINDVNYLKTYDVLTKETATLTKTGWPGLQPQISFSDDGTRLIYVYGDSSGGTTSGRIIIANADNTDQKVQKQGDWAEFQWPRFLKGSVSDYVYSGSERKVCSDGYGVCPEAYLYSVINGKETKVVKIVSRIAGFNTVGQAIAIKGYSFDASNTMRTLSVIDLHTNKITDLYEGKGLTLLDIGRQ